MHQRFYFAHPHDLLVHDTKDPHGQFVYVRCRECNGTVMFNLVQRDGYCFGCSSVVKLHTMYRTMKDEEIAEHFGVPLPVSRPPRPRPPVTILPGPLSQDALKYIAWRGITTETLARLPVLQETTYHRKQWLCWRNVKGSYELRSIWDNEKRMPAGSTKTYSYTLMRPESKKCVICEGIFSTLSYAQLFSYAPDVYITLNSVSIVPKIAPELDKWLLCGVEQITLALDYDTAGVQATHALYRAFKDKVPVRVEYPQHGDWNDVLREGKY